MSDTVIVALIIAIVILAALVIFRKQLSKLFVKISPNSVEAGLETHQVSDPAQVVAAPPPATQAPPAGAGERASVTISGNKQIGVKQKIDVGRPDVAITDNLQLGEDQEIVVRPDQDSGEQKP
jgi:hypothetical protein